MKSIVFTFGRMNPPTIGHAKLVDKVISIAKSKRADHRIYVSQSQDSRKNPLPFAEKVKLLRKIFPKANFPMERDAKTIFHVMDNIAKKEGYTDVTLVVGSDRVGEFKNVIGKYVKKSDDPSFDAKKNYDITFNVQSAGARDPDATGVEGMSASKMREFVKDGDMDSFVAGFPVKNMNLARSTFKSISRYLKEQVEPIAIFVSGGPASGKDLVVRDLVETFNIKEIQPEDLSGTVTQNLIINGQPQDFGRPKLYLEDLGYSTAYINVSISDDASQERNIFRKKPLTEEKRRDKLSAYNRIAKQVEGLFEHTYTFNNSVDYNDNPEFIKEQLNTMKTELNEKLLDGLKDWMKGTNSPIAMQKALQAYFKAIDEKGRHRSKKTMSNMALGAEVAMDFGIGPRKFTDWIIKNYKILGIDKKYQMTEEVNEQFENMLGEMSDWYYKDRKGKVHTVTASSAKKARDMMTKKIGRQVMLNDLHVDKSEVNETNGAGFFGTPELTKKLSSQTPGQEKLKLPPPKGDKYNEPRAKVYGKYIGGPRGKLKKKINESVGQYGDERTARKVAYDNAITQVDPWTTLHVVMHKDGTYTVMLDMNLRTKSKPGDKSVASYTSSSVKDGTQKDPSAVPKTFQQFIGNKGVNY